MKYCSKCKKNKKVNEFGRNQTTIDKKQRWCRLCDREYKRNWLIDNKKVQIERIRKNNVKANQRNQDYVWKYLLEHPCVDCGENDILCLQFDHVQGEKISGVGVMLNKALSLKTIIKEIKKCNVRCANCHMKITARRGVFARYRWFVQRKDSNLIHY